MLKKQAEKPSCTQVARRLCDTPRDAATYLLVYHEAALILEPTGYWAALTEGFVDMVDPTEPFRVPEPSSGQNGSTNGVPN